MSFRLRLARENTSGAGHNYTPVFIPRDLASLDRKTDDGDPGSGSLIGEANTSFTEDGMDHCLNADGDYDLSYDDLACYVAFTMPR